MKSQLSQKCRQSRRRLRKWSPRMSQSAVPRGLSRATRALWVTEGCHFCPLSQHMQITWSTWAQRPCRKPLYPANRIAASLGRTHPMCE